MKRISRVTKVSFIYAGIIYLRRYYLFTKVLLFTRYYETRKFISFVRSLLPSSPLLRTDEQNDVLCFFAHQYICSENPVFVFTFLPFCPVSCWSQLVYGRGRVETHFYLSGIGVATLQSRPRLVTNPRRSAQVVMATECL